MKKVMLNERTAKEFNKAIEQHCSAEVREFFSKLDTDILYFAFTSGNEIDVDEIEEAVSNEDDRSYILDYYAQESARRKAENDRNNCAIVGIPYNKNYCYIW